MWKRLKLRLGALAGDCALNQAVGVGLGSKNSRIFAGVLDVLVPREVCRGLACVCISQVQKQLTNLEVVLVWQSVVDCLDLRNNSKDVVSHLVHGGLDTGAVVLSEDLQCDVPGRLPSTIEVDSLDLLQCLELLPLPTSFDFCTEDAVPGLGQTRVLVTVEAMESRAGALKYEQLLDLGADRRALALPCYCLNNADLVTVAVEGVRVGLAIDLHARPSVLNNLDVCGVDVRVGFDEVVANDSGELLRRVDRVLFGEDVGGLLLGVCGNDDGVVCLSVASKRQHLIVFKLLRRLTRSRYRLQAECGQSALQRYEYQSWGPCRPCTGGRCPCRSGRS